MVGGNDLLNYHSLLIKADLYLDGDGSIFI